MTGLAFNRLANLFPLIEGSEFYELAEDIREHGLRKKIDLIDVEGEFEILDGRNRYRALVWIVTTAEILGAGWGSLAGRKLEADALLEFSGGLYSVFNVAIDGDPLDYVLSENLRRRHLTDDQRRMVAAELVNMGRGRPGKTSQSANISREQAAATLATDVAGVDRARSVVARAAPEVVEAVKSGDLTVASAAAIAAQPAEKQAEIVQVLQRDESGKLTDESKKQLAPLIKEIRAEKIAKKREARSQREAELGLKIQALPEKKYGVAIEDFEWHHAAWSEATGSEKSPSMHYETALDAQTPEAIVARCAERFACLADDCILFKWSTIPHAAIAHKVLELQGFKYVSQLVWNKERAGEARGPGYWVTGEHEIILIGVRGNVVAPATAHFRSNFSAPVGAHSEKPPNIHEIIEFHWPNVPKVEFNARRARLGWASWGNQAPDAGSGVSDFSCFDTVCTSRDDCLAEGCRRAAAGASATPRAEVPVVPAPEDAPAEQVVAQPVEPLADPHANAAPPAEGPGPVLQDIDSGEIFDAAEIDALCQAAAERDEDHRYPEGHVIAMTNPVIDGEQKTVGTCACGVVFRFAWGEHRRMDAAIELHRQQVEQLDERAEELVDQPEPEPEPEPAIASPLADEELRELDELKAISDFCHPRRAEILAAVAAGYQDKGLAISISGPGGYILREAGWARLRELEALQPKKPAPKSRQTKRPPTARPQGELDLARIDTAPPEIVDDKVQTRIPLTDDELELHAALTAIAAGGDAADQVHWTIKRDLIGAGFLWVPASTDEDAQLRVTDSGQTFLAQLVEPAREGTVA